MCGGILWRAIAWPVDGRCLQRKKPRIRSLVRMRGFPN